MGFNLYEEKSDAEVAGKMANNNQHVAHRTSDDFERGAFGFDAVIRGNSASRLAQDFSMNHSHIMAAGQYNGQTPMKAEYMAAVEEDEGPDGVAEYEYAQALLRGRYHQMLSKDLSTRAVQSLAPEDHARFKEKTGTYTELEAQPEADVPAVFVKAV